MVEYTRGGVMHRVETAAEGYVPEISGGVVVSVRPENMHPSVEELREAEAARRRRLGLCAEIMAGM